MKRKIARYISIVLVLLLAVPFSARAVPPPPALVKGETAPPFAALDKVKKSPLVLVYFFSLTAKSAREGLPSLKELYEQYQKAGIAILAVTRDTDKTITAYQQDQPLPFPVISDDGTLFKAYRIGALLPTTYVVGPGKRISDRIDGGGPSSLQFITTIAERGLQLKKTDLAKGLYQTALKTDPKNTKAKAGVGYAYLKEGKLDRAQEEFSAIAKLPSAEAVLGKEGLVAIHLEKKETDKALSLAEEIKQVDPDSGLVHLVKGNVLATQGKQEAALTEFNQAMEGKLSTDWQRAEAANNAGRIYSDKADYAKAEQMYTQASFSNPYSAEILSNTGRLYEKQGQTEKALTFYQDAQTADPADDISRHLARRMEQHLAFQEDMERKKRMDTLISELVVSFKAGKKANPPPSDPWSSRPMTVAFINLKQVGGGLMRDGFLDVLQAEVANHLGATGRVGIVEREMLDQLLMELKLGSSELADPDTALKLGKLLSAQLIVTGSLVSMPDGARLSLRLIDPETSAIKITHADEISAQTGLLTFAEKTAKTVGAKIRQQFPFKGKVAVLDDANRVAINLGSRHGVHVGMRFTIIDEGEPIVVDGKQIGHKKKQVGFLEIVEVEEGLSYGRVTEKKEVIRVNQKVLEQVEQNEPSL